MRNGDKYPMPEVRVYEVRDMNCPNHCVFATIKTNNFLRGIRAFWSEQINDNSPVFERPYDYMVFDVGYHWEAGGDFDPREIPLPVCTLMLGVVIMEHEITQEDDPTDDYVSWDGRMKPYCVQNDGDCQTCSLVNYGRDCQNNPITKEQDNG